MIFGFVCLSSLVSVITSNLRLSDMPGNVRLRKGEAGLPRPSVVDLSQLVTVNKSRLTERIGRMGTAKLRQVLDGLDLLLGITT